MTRPSIGKAIRRAGSLRRAAFSVSCKKGRKAVPSKYPWMGKGWGAYPLAWIPEPRFSRSAFLLTSSFCPGNRKMNEFIRNVTAERKIKKREVPGNLKRVDRDLYVSENGFYEIEPAQNTAFFRKKGFSYVPLCESALPVESVMTLLTGFIRKKDYSVQAAFHQYGFKTTEMAVPLENMINCCLEEGCTPYVGIESKERDAVVATLFMVNRTFGYAHTFRFTLNTEILERAAGVLQARAYLYTPLYPKKS